MQLGCPIHFIQGIAASTHFRGDAEADPEMARGKRQPKDATDQNAALRQVAERGGVVPVRLREDRRAYLSADGDLNGEPGDSALALTLKM